MRIRDEWLEFEALARKYIPARYRRWMDHRLFPYFVCGYPAVFLLILLLANYGGV